MTKTDEELVAALDEAMRFGYVPLAVEDAIMAVRNRLSSLSRGETGWLPIESAPTDGRSVLVFCPRAPDHGYERIRLTWRKDGKWQGANNTSWPPTHWMPLPAPPSQGGE